MGHNYSPSPSASVLQASPVPSPQLITSASSRSLTLEEQLQAKLKARQRGHSISEAPGAIQAPPPVPEATNVPQSESSPYASSTLPRTKSLGRPSPAVLPKVGRPGPSVATRPHLLKHQPGSVDSEVVPNPIASHVQRPLVRSNTTATAEAQYSSAHFGGLTQPPSTLPAASKMGTVNGYVTPTPPHHVIAASNQASNSESDEEELSPLAQALRAKTLRKTGDQNDRSSPRV